VHSLSLVIPAYNPDLDFAAQLSVLCEFLRLYFASFEVLIVNDASNNDSFHPKQRQHYPLEARIIDLPTNRGKFGALKVGIHQSTGTCCIFTDADLPYDFQAIPYITEMIVKRGLHVVVGDRFLSESLYESNGNPLRTLTTNGFRLFVRTIITGGLFDTQCGIKGFRGDIARALFPLLREERFAGDVELLYVALKYNFEIKRIPVRLLRSGTSSVHIVRDSLRMLRALTHLKINWRKGVYESSLLSELASQRYWEKL
jgi:dolichyl-phosphate beta-glucosyltransferase